MYRKRVLIVEDNELNREILREILSVEYQVLEAENGKKALEILAEHRSSIATASTGTEMINPTTIPVESLARGSARNGTGMYRTHARGRIRSVSPSAPASAAP